LIFSRFKWNHSTILELSYPLKAYVYYRRERFNLLTGFPEAYSIEEFNSTLEQMKLSFSFKNSTVYHFYYEYGLVQMGLGHLVPQDAPLVVELEYKKSTKTSPRKPRITSLGLKSLERPNWTEYKRAFAQTQKHLIDGDCYQVNLTFPFDFISDDFLDVRDIADYFFYQGELGAYAHCSYIGEEMILSNSPECLFQYRDQNQDLFTMPIKGTRKLGINKVSEIWKEMLADKKEEGELTMITDLLKNDLNKLHLPKAKVKRLRAPLEVPGLLHQYSLISIQSVQNVSLGKTIKALFPGGSITGAPKKRVMEIISEVECFQRGIYCGSTLLCTGEKKVASINIRTALIRPEERIWRYGAGGGITLLSKPVDEFNEMESKVASFMKLLKNSGY
jgi:para-aminobenzoate synthetase component 1